MNLISLLLIAAMFGITVVALNMVPRGDRQAVRVSENGERSRMLRSQRDYQ